jgi:glucokinase
MKKCLLFVVLVIALCCFFCPAFAGFAETSTVVLSGDIGGTNARLRLTQLKNNEKHVLFNETYKVANFGNVLKIVHLFLSKHKANVGRIDSACLAINEPVKNGKAYRFDEEQLKTDLKIDNIKLINDLEAVGYGIESLTEKDLYLLQKGTLEKNGVKAFIAAGTWLGMGFATFNGSQYVVHPSQGGESNFAPSDDIQMNILNNELKKISDVLLKHSKEKYHGTISAERILRGHGIVTIYDYLRTVNPFNYTENECLKKLLEESKDKPKEIADFALAHNDDQLSVKALEIFVNIYGAKSSDIAYTLLPRGGLYIVGNIAASILTKYPFDKIFMRAFSGSFLKEFPVWVVLNTEVGLQGAENCAFKLVLSHDDQSTGLKLDL